jgi:hypothetical protein
MGSLGDIYDFTETVYTLKAMNVVDLIELLNALRSDYDYDPITVNEVLHALGKRGVLL